jgi:hypothetical protein
VINSVVAFRSTVKNTTDNEREPITTSALDDILRDPSSDAPITTGRSGNMHGASTVNIPARMEMTKKTILLYLRG